MARATWVITVASYTTNAIYPPAHPLGAYSSVRCFIVGITTVPGGVDCCVPLNRARPSSGLIHEGRWRETTHMCLRTLQGRPFSAESMS